jgi:hypothetical protein
MPKELFPFRYRDELTGKWVRARYVAERNVIAERYREWEITGPPEIRSELGSGYFRPYPPRAGPGSSVERKPGLDKDERYLVLLFLRRYVTWCARRRRYAQMQGAARLFRTLRGDATAACRSVAVRS